MPCERPSTNSSTPSSTTWPRICGSVETAVRLATEALLTGDADDRRAGDQRGRRDRPRPRAGRGLGVPAARRCSSRSPATCARSSRRCGWSASSSGWATCRCTSPRSPGSGCPTSRCPADVRPIIERMAAVAEDMVTRVSQDHHRPRRRRRARARPRRRGDGPAAPRQLRRAALRPTGATASRRPSTSPCSVATTSGSPTTPSRSPTGSSSSSPARTRARSTPEGAAPVATDEMAVADARTTISSVATAAGSATLVGDGGGSGGGGLGVEVGAAGDGRRAGRRRARRPAACRWGC